jgi:hypothetical protein
MTLAQGRRLHRAEDGSPGVSGRRWPEGPSRRPAVRCRTTRSLADHYPQAP